MRNFLVNIMNVLRASLRPSKFAIKSPREYNVKNLTFNVATPLRPCDIVNKRQYNDVAHDTLRLRHETQ